MLRRRPGMSILTITLVWCLVAPPAYSESAEEAEQEKNNTLGIFVGITEEERRENGLALGVEGSHYFRPSFGVAGVVEYTFGDIDAWVIVAAPVYRTGRWKFWLGPGIEESDASDDVEFLVRAGTDYSFEVGSFEIAPQLNFDFVDGDIVAVLGVLFAREF